MSFNRKIFFSSSEGLLKRLIATGLLIGLLTSCASSTDQTSQLPAASSTQSPAQATTSSAATGSTNSPAENTNPTSALQNANRPDPGINRDGRVIQLGNFTEVIPAVELPDNDVIELNYEQEDLRLIFEQLGDALQINMLIDPTINDKVSLRTSAGNPLSYADIWPLMRLLARNAAVTIEQAGNIYEFTKSNANIPVELTLPSGLDDTSSSEVLQITPLTYISIETAETILAPLLPAQNAILHLGTRNLIGLSGSPEQLSRINALLNIIDDDPFQNQGIHLYELSNSDATDVAEELITILETIEGTASSYQVLGLGRINSVLVIAPAERGFKEVDRWINILDAGNQEQVEQLFFYEVKNLSAQSLAATLSEVFEQEEEDDIPRESADNDAPPFLPFALREGLVGPGTDSAASNSATVSADLSVTIVANEDTNSLLIRSTPRDYRQLLTTINNLDRLPLQVLINAVIGQVTLTDSTQFGVDWSRVSGNLSSGPARLSSRVLPNGILDDEGLATQGSGLVLTQIFTDGAAIIDVTLRAIAQDNQVSLLSRPTIMAADNQEGEIKVGQEVPVDSGSTLSGNGNTVSNISYKSVGIILTITPHINEDGFINLEIHQELSAVEEGAGGVNDNPIFTSQEITTTAIVADGALITLGGLIQEVESGQKTGVPGLKNIPVLGGLFSYQESKTERRELFIILRPQIINGGDRDQVIMQQFRDQFESVSALFEEAGY